MISADIMRRLAALSLPAGVFQEVLTIFADVMRSVDALRNADVTRREEQRQRQKKYRENKKRVMSPSHNALRNDCGKERSPIPPKENNLLSFSATTVAKEERSEIVALASDWPSNFREQFWSKYPRRVGKAAAMRKLDQVRRGGKVKFVDLLAAVERYRGANLELQFTKHPAVWLNQGCWEDDPAAISGNGHTAPMSQQETDQLLEFHRQQSLLRRN